MSTATANAAKAWDAAFKVATACTSPNEWKESKMKTELPKCPSGGYCHSQPDCPDFNCPGHPVNGCPAFVERKPAEQPAQQHVLLARDLAEILGANLRDVCAALVALGGAPRSTNMYVSPDEAIKVAKHLKAQQHEPVAILNHAHGVHAIRSVKLNGLPDGEYRLYTSPQPASKPWVGLTDEEVAVMMMEAWGCARIAPRHAPAFARAIEAKLREKNTAPCKPLTDEQIAHATAPVFMGGSPSLTAIARAIEAAHGIKE